MATVDSYIKTTCPLSGIGANNAFVQKGLNRERHESDGVSLIKTVTTDVSWYSSPSFQISKLGTDHYKQTVFLNDNRFTNGQINCGSTSNPTINISVSSESLTNTGGYIVLTPSKAWTSMVSSIVNCVPATENRIATPVTQFTVPSDANDGTAGTVKKLATNSSTSPKTHQIIQGAYNAFVNPKITINLKHSLIDSYVTYVLSAGSIPTSTNKRSLVVPTNQGKIVKSTASSNATTYTFGCPIKTVSGTTHYCYVTSPIESNPAARAVSVTSTLTIDGAGCYTPNYTGNLTVVLENNNIVQPAGDVPRPQYQLTTDCTYSMNVTGGAIDSNGNGTFVMNLTSTPPPFESYISSTTHSISVTEVTRERTFSIGGLTTGSKPNSTQDYTITVKCTNHSGFTGNVTSGKHSTFNIPIPNSTVANDKVYYTWTFTRATTSTLGTSNYSTSTDTSSSTFVLSWDSAGFLDNISIAKPTAPGDEPFSHTHSQLASGTHTTNAPAVTETGGVSGTLDYTVTCKIKGQRGNEYNPSTTGSVTLTPTSLITSRGWEFRIDSGKYTVDSQGIVKNQVSGWSFSECANGRAGGYSRRYWVLRSDTGTKVYSPWSDVSTVSEEGGDISAHIS